MTVFNRDGSPNYECVGPITARDGDVLADLYGFSSIEALAKSIPEGVEVIDIGAGFSSLGHEVTRIRDDINWVNFDVAYENTGYGWIRKTIDTLVSEAPDNLVYETGSILAPPSEWKNRFVSMFSYYMLPHIINLGRPQGIKAAQNMFSIGAPGGTLSIGPKSIGFGDAYTITVPDTEPRSDILAAEVVDSWLKEWSGSRKSRGLIN